jgi:hypothetical protein
LLGAQEKKAAVIQNRTRAIRNILKIFAKVRAGRIGLLKITNGKGLNQSPGLPDPGNGTQESPWAFEKVWSGPV